MDVNVALFLELNLPQCLVQYLVEPIHRLISSVFFVPLLTKKVIEKTFPMCTALKGGVFGNTC